MRRIIPIVPWIAASGLLAAAPPPPVTDPPGTALLRGPTVSDDATRTLVNVDARGMFIPVQGRPEEAALALVPLDPEIREKVREIVAERNTRLGMLLVDHIDLVREASDAILAGDNETAQKIQLEVYDLFEPTRPRDPLLEALAGTLTDAHRAETVRLLDEYWNAWIDWQLRGTMNAGDAARDRIRQRLSFQLFQQELGEAYNWSLRPFRYRMEALYEITQPTEEQRAAIRDVMLEYIREGRLQPSAEQRRDASSRIWEILTEAQRQRVFESVLWRM